MSRARKAHHRADRRLGALGREAMLLDAAAFKRGFDDVLFLKPLFRLLARLLSGGRHEAPARRWFADMGSARRREREGT